MARQYYDDLFYPVDLPHSFAVNEYVPIDTGLLDQHGNPIYKDRPRVGFVTDFSQKMKPRIRVKARSGF